MRRRPGVVACVNETSLARYYHSSEGTTVRIGRHKVLACLTCNRVGCRHALEVYRAIERQTVVDERPDELRTTSPLYEAELPWVTSPLQFERR